MSYSFATKSGTAISLTIPLSKVVDTHTLTVEFDDMSNFETPLLTKTPLLLAGGKSVSLSLTSAEIDAIKDCYFRVKAVKSGVTSYLQSGSVSYNVVYSTPAAVGDLRAFNIHTPYNYGAVGDGIANDTAAIQTAIDARGKTVIPPGIYGVDLIANLIGTGNHGALLLRSGTKLEIQAGAEIRLRSGQTVVGNNQTAIIRNANNFAGAAPYDADITVYGDGVINGNAANNVTADLYGGITLGKVLRPVVKGITVKNCRGTMPGPPGETMGVNLWRCLDFLIDSVQVFGDDGGETASGIGSNQCVVGRVSNCSTHHLKNGVGNTHWDGSQIVVSNCHSYLNGGFGFLTEHSEDITFVNCIAGGIVTDYDMAATNTALSPIGTLTTLGNAQLSTATNAGGFGIDSGTRISLLGCEASYNGLTVAQNASGVNIYGSVTLTKEILIDNCRIFGNRRGVKFENGDGAAAAVARMRATKITSTTTIGPNKHVDGLSAEQVFTTSSGASTVSKGTIPGFLVTAHAPVAATGVAVPNPFPFDVEVILAGGTVTGVTITPGGPSPSVGYAVGVTGPFRVPHGGSITLAYSAAPTWTWVIP